MSPDSGVHSAALSQSQLIHTNSDDNLQLYTNSSATAHSVAMSQSQLVLSAGNISTTCVDVPVIEGHVTLNHCKDVHIGNKYENNGDIVIHQKISVVSGEGGSLEGLSDHCRQIVVRDVTESANSNTHKLTGHLGYLFGHKRNRCVSSLVVILIVLFIATIILFLLIKNREDNNYDLENFRGASINSAELEREYPQSLKFVWRDTWGAAQPTGSRGNNSLPVERIIMCHSASQGTCNKFSACKERVLSFQELHMDSNHDYGDIGYNFVIGGDGYIYVGRGWDKVGAHTRGYNNNSLGVAFIGDFRVDELNDNMKTAAKTLVGFGVETGKLSKDYQVYGHCQVLGSLPVSPGRNVLKFLKTWPHWNSTNLNQCKG